MTVRLERWLLGGRVSIRSKLLIAGAGLPPLRPHPSSRLPKCVTRAMGNRLMALEHERLRVAKAGELFFGTRKMRLDRLIRKALLAEEGFVGGCRYDR